MIWTPRRLAHLGFGLAVVALGLSVTGGWLLHVPAMVRLKGGALPLVFNTGLGFVLAGSTALLLRSTRRGARLWCGTASAMLVLLAVATLAEIISDRNFGIDLAAVHAWLEYGNVKPGRMAPNTAIGFALIGCAVLLGQHVRTKGRALLVVVLCFAVLAVGFTGLAGYMLALELLFGWAKSARMAVPTALGMIACALALAFAWSDDWFTSRRFFREDEKIRLLGAATLVVMTLTVGLTGFVLLQESLEKSLSASLAGLAKSRGAWLKSLGAEHRVRSVAAVGLSRFDEAARKRLQHERGSDSQLEAIAKRLVEGAFRGVALVDATGAMVARFGDFAQVPAVSAALDDADRLELVWAEALLLRHRMVLNDGPRVLGSILIDTAVPAPEETLFDISGLGRTGEVNACTEQRDELLCFPGSAHEKPFRTKRTQGSKLRPMELALRGGEGVTVTVDYRQANVFAAYGPIHPGLGFVVKQATSEVYAPIREALKTGAPIILLMALVGAGLLYLQLHPLAARLWKLERAATEDELKVRAIMAATGDGIVTTTPEGRIQDMNPAARRLFGLAGGASLATTHCLSLSPVMGRRQNLRQLLRASRRASGGGSPPCVELWGARADGDVFPLELTITRVPIGSSHLFVGVLRDITSRKAEQRRLADLAHYDSLTGLPNRTLFRDRLATAALRSAREHCDFALLFLDLDGFKQVNDSLGHQAGDLLLKEVAQRLGRAVRKTDTVARLSGDEFTVILEKLADADSDAQDVAHKIVDAIREPFWIESQLASVTVSVGLVVHDAADGPADTDKLLCEADKAMYQAKRRGKDRIRAAQQKRVTAAKPLARNEPSPDEGVFVASVLDTLW